MVLSSIVSTSSVSAYSKPRRSATGPKSWGGDVTRQPTLIDRQGERTHRAAELADSLTHVLGLIPPGGGELAECARDLVPNQVLGLAAEL